MLLLSLILVKTNTKMHCVSRIPTEENVAVKLLATFLIGRIFCFPVPPNCVSGHQTGCDFNTAVNINRASVAVGMTQPVASGVAEGVSNDTENMQESQEILPVLLLRVVYPQIENFYF